MTEPSWDHYRAALAVLEEGSLSGAARALGLTQPTLGRQIAALERALGVALFTRSPTGLAPTEAALILAPYARALKATADALHRAVASEAEGLSGRVRITASEVVGAEVLPAILAGLHARHPGLAVDVMLSDRMQDLLHRDADIAVRMAPPTQGALVARRVGIVRLGLYGHRRYLAARGLPERPADLDRHSVIGFDAETPFLRGMMRQAPALAAARFAWRSDSTLAQLAAVRAGFGLGACHTALAARDPDLIRVVPEIVWELPTFVAMHEDLRSLRRCRATFDALAEGMAAYCAE
ncbi:LysR family transcriptional regulator [Methylobacterium indicum]|uniref:LysR family transcriptional regulator n=2 Tax=Methylobacterium indicum TaxID=1775910 RepID=UPI0007343CEE|nr:LysR family transcriptional regulator [Methylobacterium indicum]KTS11172.1 LysR family transcriptional regulator [Methylobacterium indicum]KTS14451.1 LysR family transcriptional regulator [Methylobacterium indicum]